MMKNCPKCGLKLPDKAHFCPRCMYEYPRTEIVQCELKQKKRHGTVITVVVVIAVFLLTVCGIAIKQMAEKNAVQKEIEKQEQLKQVFRTGEDIPYNDEVIYDLRDCMAEWESVYQKLGEETKEPFAEGEYTVHVYENMEISVDSTGMVQDIYIRYGEGMHKEKYGLYGFCGNTEKDRITEIMGAPEQNYGENEYFYHFDGLNGAPTLRFLFSDSGAVEEIEYYR